MLLGEVLLAMPRALSVDLRLRIVHACQAAQMSQREIAKLFEVHVKTVEKLWRQFRETSGVEPRAGGRGPQARLATAHDALRTWVAENNDRTLAELCLLLRERLGLVTSPPALCRTLQRLGLRLKKSHWRPVSASARMSSRRASSSGA